MINPSSSISKLKVLLKTKSAEIAVVAGILPGLAITAQGVATQSIETVAAGIAFTSVVGGAALASSKISRLAATINRSIFPEKHAQQRRKVMQRIKSSLEGGAQDSPLSIGNEAYNLKMIDSSSLAKLYHAEQKQGEKSSMYILDHQTLKFSHLLDEPSLTNDVECTHEDNPSLTM